MLACMPDFALRKTCRGPLCSAMMMCFYVLRDRVLFVWIVCGFVGNQLEFAAMSQGHASKLRLCAVGPGCYPVTLESYPPRTAQTQAAGCG
jgi:hypothetical protein